MIHEYHNNDCITRVQYIHAGYCSLFTLFGKITVAIVFIDQWSDYNSVTSVVRTDLGVNHSPLYSTECTVWILEVHSNEEIRKL